jgi:hypothetical protein
MARRRKEYPLTYDADIKKVLSLKPKEHFEVNAKIFRSFRVVLSSHIRKIPEYGEFKIISLRVSKDSVFMFRIENFKKSA